jgi:D-alanyl-lipoteichoic acid acyltransferase DltB (MBOAT superfamily)
MLFPTVEFAIFFLVVFAASWALAPSPRARKALLLVASYVFYGWWDWRFCFLLAQCALVNYVVALWLDETQAPKRRSAILALGVTLNLGVLGFFKYWGFFMVTLADLLASLGGTGEWRIMEVLLPVGVSFFTFQGLSYLTDVYRGKLKPTASFLDLALLMSFFPHLVAGPLVRASEFLPQLEKPVDPSAIRATRAFVLLGVGLFKKVVIAHYLAVDLVAPVFEAPGSFGAVDLVAGAYGYAVQIYCDFSAYSDMAIGLAWLLGYEFPRNFDQPYRSVSLSEFWRRWHISLSSFLRDYLYIPLGGSRRGKLMTYRNLFLTMALGGLWHGAAWTFVIWGVLHGTALGVERWLEERFGAAKRPAMVVARRVVTFHFVCLTWIFFNADSFGGALDYLAAFGATPLAAPRMLTPLVVLLLAIGLAAHYVPSDLIDRLEERAGRVPLLAQATALAVAVMVVAAFGPGTLAPFIYFKF